MTQYETIARAIEYLSVHAKENPSLEELAKYLHLSPESVAKTFSEWAGITPKQFSRYLTLDYAREILSQSGESQLKISEKIGLSSQSRLHDLFVDIEAMTPEEYRNNGAGLSIEYSFSEGLFGPYLVASTPKGICNILFVETREQGIQEIQARWSNAKLLEKKNTLHESVESFLAHAKSLKKIKLHLKGTNFQLKVWEALLSIPEGRYSTYGRIANDINHPTAVRAVGTAIGDNPIAYIIPCHRVLRTSGEIGGYHWGLTRKRIINGYEASKGEL